MKTKLYAIIYTFMNEFPRVVSVWTNKDNAEKRLAILRKGTKDFSDPLLLPKHLTIKTFTLNESLVADKVFFALVDRGFDTIKIHQVYATINKAFKAVRRLDEKYKDLPDINASVLECEIQDPDGQYPDQAWTDYITGASDASDDWEVKSFDNGERELEDEVFTGLTYNN